jgi:agmatinase
VSDGTIPDRGSPDTPRVTGIRSFARLPHTHDLEGVDVAVVGAPFDNATSFRPGARFGPEAIRSASVLLRDYHPVLDVEVFSELSIRDWGDAPIVPTSTPRSMDAIADSIGEILGAGAVPLCLGGDHLIALAELRAHAAHGGSAPLILLDSHADTWDEYYGERYFHGTPFRRAVEEGAVAPERSILAGMRGPLYSPRDLEDARGLGFEVIPWDELRDMDPAEYGRRVRERVGDAPSFLSFDIDFVDPAFAPATGTPEPGGPTSAEALALVRSLAGMSFRGFDVVEVSPPYDTAGQTTALVAAAVAYELLALVAVESAQGK